MKNGLSLIMTGILFLVGCTSFPTSYDRIESDKVRLLDFIYEPAEAAPGDTVLLKAVFAGAPVSDEDLDWRISYKVVRNNYGVDTAFDIRPFINRIIEPFDFSTRTSTVAFKFVIPENVIAESPMIPSDWSSIIGSGSGIAIPEELKNVTKEQLISSIEAIADSLDNNPSFGTQLFTSEPEMISALPAMLQFLTAKIRIFARIKGGYEIESDYSVRYNSRLAEIPGIPVNHNPIIDSAGVYKVRGEGRLTYDPKENIHEFVRLASSSDPDSVTEIMIDTGFTYFVVAFTSNTDQSLTLEGVPSGRWSTEVINTMWYYSQDDSQTQNVTSSEYLNIVNMKNEICELYPPKDARIKDFTVWLEVSDELLGEMYRPQGSSLLEFCGKFSYTDAYLAKQK